MNKWLEILLGLILVIAPIIEGIANYTGLNLWVAAWSVLKGGVFWGVVLLGLLFLMLGISDLKE